MKKILPRNELLRGLTSAIVAIRQEHPTRVAIDGVDGAGKTILADELARFIEARGRTVIRASIDGFHRPREARYKLGIDSPEGFYHDSFDYEQLRSALLDPLGPGGNRRYRMAVFDWRKNTGCRVSEQVAAANAVLLFDGVFAQRPELRNFWDFVLFLQVEFEETLRRSQIRDAKPDQPPVELQRRFWSRYAAGQRLYFAEAQPRLTADVVVDNNDPRRPVVLGGAEYVC